MLNYDPSKRPSASECLQYPFFDVRVPIPVNAPDFDSSSNEYDVEEELKIQ